MIKNNNKNNKNNNNNNIYIYIYTYIYIYMLHTYTFLRRVLDKLPQHRRTWCLKQTALCYEDLPKPQKRISHHFGSQLPTSGMGMAPSADVGG